MVAADTIGNMTRPPKRSVSAPTGMRPSEPTTTGTATSSACWKAESPRESLNRGPSGLSSAHAQKLTANPRVATVNMAARLPAVGSPARGSTGCFPPVPHFPFVPCVEVIVPACRPRPAVPPARADSLRSHPNKPDGPRRRHSRTG
ncbi:hypothetical protein CLV40_10923 [Actinokineospora auranticolor]|uniref:Uncharacterized protein n=1 Tax=Actinokineospora auranticolor TaxID=155976 RepID=A0A2S6GN37_9PSEU|nr:hypothetical protein CLV40_10923 [Actinokineospora auranticolor]